MSSTAKEKAFTLTQLKAAKKSQFNTKAAGSRAKSQALGDRTISGKVSTMDTGRMENATVKA